jgi:hypothetical protein
VKKSYTAPGLVVYGRVDELTLGSSGSKADFLGQNVAQSITIIGVTVGTDCPNLGCVTMVGSH